MYVHENLKEESSRQLTDQPSISLLFVGQEEGKDKKKPRTCIMKYGEATPEQRLRNVPAYSYIQARARCTMLYYENACCVFLYLSIYLVI